MGLYKSETLEITWTMYPPPGCEIGYLRTLSSDIMCDVSSKLFHASSTNLTACFAAHLYIIYIIIMFLLKYVSLVIVRNYRLSWTFQPNLPNYTSIYSPCLVKIRLFLLMSMKHSALFEATTSKQVLSLLNIRFCSILLDSLCRNYGKIVSLTFRMNCLTLKRLI